MVTVDLTIKESLLDFLPDNNRSNLKVQKENAEVTDSASHAKRQCSA